MRCQVARRCQAVDGGEVEAGNERCQSMTNAERGRTVHVHEKSITAADEYQS